MQWQAESHVGYTDWLDSSESTQTSRPSTLYIELFELWLCRIVSPDNDCADRHAIIVKPAWIASTAFTCWILPLLNIAYYYLKYMLLKTTLLYCHYPEILKQYCKICKIQTILLCSFEMSDNGIMKYYWVIVHLRPYSLMTVNSRIGMVK